MDVILVRGDPHAGETLFVHFPAHHIAFEADITDYTLSARHFLRVVEERGLRIDRIYGAHTSTVVTLRDIEDEEPSN